MTGSHAERVFDELSCYYADMPKWTSIYHIYFYFTLKCGLL